MELICEPVHQTDQVNKAYLTKKKGVLHVGEGL